MLVKYTKQECLSSSLTLKISLFQLVLLRKLRELLKVPFPTFINHSPFIMCVRPVHNIIIYLLCRKILLLAKCIRCCNLSCNKGCFVSPEKHMKHLILWFSVVPLYVVTIRACSLVSYQHLFLNFCVPSLHVYLIRSLRNSYCYFHQKKNELLFLYS